MCLPTLVKIIEFGTVNIKSKYAFCIILKNNWLKSILQNQWSLNQLLDPLPPLTSPPTPSQHAELFSKLAFGVGKYQELDMAALDITKVQDFATYMALVANGQGRNGAVALESFHRKAANSSIAGWCFNQGKVKS